VFYNKLQVKSENLKKMENEIIKNRLEMKFIDGISKKLEREINLIFHIQLKGGRK